ncbi:unnamed protein product [Lampetra planeri]
MRRLGLRLSGRGLPPLSVSPARLAPPLASYSLGLLPASLAKREFSSSAERGAACWLVLGLGNPGMAGTRHSVGVVAVRRLAERLGAGSAWRGDRAVAGTLAEVGPPGGAPAWPGGPRLVLLASSHPMNVNGLSAALAAKKFSVPAQEVVLLHDDVDKPLGHVALKHGGSARGHNGVKSCIHCLRSDAMVRLRIGVGRGDVARGSAALVAHVLAPFSAEEEPQIQRALERGIDLLLAHMGHTGGHTGGHMGEEAPR